MTSEWGALAVGADAAEADKKGETVTTRYARFDEALQQLRLTAPSLVNASMNLRVISRDGHEVTSQMTFLVRGLAQAVDHPGKRARGRARPQLTIPTSRRGAMPLEVVIGRSRGA